jgi:hypothetical protein
MPLSVPGLSDCLANLMARNTTPAIADRKTSVRRPRRNIRRRQVEGGRRGRAVRSCRRAGSPASGTADVRGFRELVWARNHPAAGLDLAVVVDGSYRSEAELFVEPGWTAIAERVAGQEFGGTVTSNELHDLTDDLGSAVHLPGAGHEMPATRKASRRRPLDAVTRTHVRYSALWLVGWGARRPSLTPRTHLLHARAGGARGTDGQALLGHRPARPSTWSPPRVATRCLAELIGMSPGTLGSRLHCRTVFTVTEVVRVASILDVDLVWLLAGTADPVSEGRLVDPPIDRQFGPRGRTLTPSCSTTTTSRVR